MPPGPAGRDQPVDRSLEGGPIRGCRVRDQRDDERVEPALAGGRGDPVTPRPAARDQDDRLPCRVRGADVGVRGDRLLRRGREVRQVGRTVLEQFGGDPATELERLGQAVLCGAVEHGGV